MHYLILVALTLMLYVVGEAILPRRWSVLVIDPLAPWHGSFNIAQFLGQEGQQLVISSCFFITARHYASASVVLAVVVCLSVTRWYCIKMAKCRIMQTTPHNSPGTLAFRC